MTTDAAQPVANARETAPVGTRHVFYVHGFDPRGPAVYHGMCRQAAENRVDGWRIDVSARTRASPVSWAWQIEAEGNDGLLRATYEYLRWDDVVRKLWGPRNGIAVFINAWRVFSVYRSTGILQQLHAPAWAAYAAIVMQAWVGLIFAFGVFLLTGLLCWAFGAVIAARGLPPWYVWLLGAFMIGGAALLWRRIDRWLNLEWVTRGLRFLIGTAQGSVVIPDERIEALATRVADARAGGSHEVVVVAHSVGAVIAIKMLARVLGALPADPERPLVFITLGQSIPLYTLLGGDAAFRQDLARVANNVHWLDVTSGSDPASACLMNPLAGLESACVSARIRHLQPDFHDTLTRARFKFIRRRPFEFHFQYLKASDSPTGFDYFRLICGRTPVSRRN